MWCLINENDQKVIYIAGQNTEVIIGRNADLQTFSFVIPEDPSISRKHAILSKLNGELFLEDLGSRYGTFIDNSNEKIESKNKIKLNVGNVVKFGKMNSVFIVHYKSLVTCTSTLKGENLNNLRQCLINLSGMLKNEWDESCMFLTMPAITLTMKVVLALAQGAYIVTVNFWSKCLEAMNSQTILPDPSNYTPQVIESTLNKENVSFLPNSERKLLFSGKKVVFFSKRQFEMYKMVLTKASAIALLLSECKMTKSSLCENDVIVIQYNINLVSQETQAQQSLIQDIVNYMKNKGKRLINDVEIGLAILYCSTEKYCNPDFYLPSEIIKQTDQNTKPSNVLAQESQETNHNLEEANREKIVINESLSSTINIPNNIKRKVSDEDEVQGNSNKKLATDKYNLDAVNSGIKRKANEETNVIDANPIKKLVTNFEADDNQDTFNFTNKNNSNNINNQQEISAKRLNLAKPQKRKLESDDNEDNLFQFVQNKSKMSCNKSNIFESDKSSENIAIRTCSDKNISISSNNIDLKSLRGVKLEELMKHNNKLLTECDDTFKKSIKEELDDKMSDLNLGTTIVTIKKELIVKKEPVVVEEQVAIVKNFKKFKKVWPVKMQISIISRSANNTNNRLSRNSHNDNYANNTVE